MTRVFISLPMTGYSREHIDKEMDRLKAVAMERLGNGIQFEEQIIDMKVPYAAKPRVWWLACDLQELAMADYILMAKGWRMSTGCCIERAVAKAYDIKVIYEEGEADESGEDEERTSVG